MSIAERLRADDSGFGLVELLIALTILVIGIMAIFAGFSSSLLTLQRAGRASTGATVGDKEMEKYRRLAFAAIPAPSSPAPTVDTGPDGHPYWKSVNIAWACSQPTWTLDTTATPPVCTYSGSAISRAVKQITIVIRDTNSTGRILIRESSSFDEATG